MRTLGDLAATERATITVEEAGEVWGISRQLAYELARRGELPGCVRLGRRFSVAVPSLRRALGLEAS